MAKFVPQQEMPLSDQVLVRREKLENLRAEGFDPFVQTKYEITSDARTVRENFDAMEGHSVRLAGRLMSKRGMGKVSFCDLQDSTGRIQLYVKFDEMEEASFNRFKKNDITHHNILAWHLAHIVITYHFHQGIIIHLI